MRGFAFGFILFLPFLSNAQVFGGFRPSVKWKEINTDTVRVIFQSAVTPDAQRIASIIHRLAAERPNPLGSQLKKINTILHSNTTIANGYVALAPYRSEYYLIPPTNIMEMGANPWQEELAVHEYRHVQQFNNFRNGLSKAASYVFGEGGQALLNAMAVPDYFFEGDAVHTETVVTNQGRGRIPNFYNGFHALFREGKDYSWMKLRNGSMKDFIPNHYNLGYLLVNYGYLKYGDDFWAKVTKDATAFKGLVYPFQKAIKKYAGVDYKTFRQEALDFYRHEVSKKRTDVRERETFTNYYFPQYISGDSLLYLKTGYRNIPAFYIKDSRGEHRLTLQNISNDEWFGYRDGKILYTGYQVHPRWTLEDYSNIFLYDIRTGAEKKITHGAKYFTPDLSPSGERIVAVFINDSTQSELRLLGMDGKVINSIKGTENSFYVHPRFIDDRSVVVAERLANSTMRLVRVEMKSGRKEELIPATAALIAYPAISNGTVFFVSSLNGNDDLYSIQLSNKKLTQLTNGGAGNYYPSVHNDQLIWAKFSTNGLRVESVALSSIKTYPVEASQWKQVVLPYKVAGDDTLDNVLALPARNFPVTNYNQGGHLFNFHTWIPEYTDPEFTLRAYSDNVLSNFSNQLFYTYNRNETSHAVGFNTNYGGLFPVLTAGMTYTYDRTYRTLTKEVNFNEWEGRIGYYIPLNFNGGKTYKGLNFGTNFTHSQAQATGFYKDSFNTITSNYFHHFINWGQQLPKAVQQIFPKFGYTVSLAHRHLISDNGYQFLGGTRFYLPSIANHSIVVAASMQQTDTANVVFSNRFANSRGYTDYYFTKMWRLSGNYHFPLFYPDWGFGNIIYFQRLRSNIFYDYTKVFAKDWKSNRNLRSVGAEIYFDSKVWNELPITFGFRVSHLLDADFSHHAAGRNVFEFIVPVDLIPL